MFCDSDVQMNPETTSQAPTAETVRPPAIALTPKRRIKPVSEAPIIAIPAPTAEQSGSLRRTRMKRAGRMPECWKGTERPAAWISPQILSTLREATGALGKSKSKRTTNAAAGTVLCRAHNCSHQLVQTIDDAKFDHVAESEAAGAKKF